MRTGNEQATMCPFFKQQCLQRQCMLYHEEFDRCKIDLIIYNTYKLDKTIASAIPPGNSPDPGVFPRHSRLN